MKKETNIKSNTANSRIFDLKGKNLGRAASEIAHALQGKDDPAYQRNKLIEGDVIIKNAHLIKVSGRKEDSKKYYRHSGRPGHLKTVAYKAAFSKSPEWVVRNAVRGMLPKNRLQSQRLKLLKFDSSTGSTQLDSEQGKVNGAKREAAAIENK